jgi:undecaprenyl diphosphate synthase
MVLNLIKSIFSRQPQLSPRQPLDHKAQWAIPKHVAIVMDGNSRWAQLRGKNPAFGHQQGAVVAKQIVEAALEEGIGFLTLYAFSSENWGRPEDEVHELMVLMRDYLTTEVDKLIANGIRLKVIGSRLKLPQDIRELIDHVEAKTSHCQKLTLIMAISYGGREEIVRATQDLAEDLKNGVIAPHDITEESFAGYLDTGCFPDPDFIIRTSGEFRLSNFLCWQAAYSELYFTQTLWPDFSRDELIEALIDFNKRSRRFGHRSAHEKFA